MVSRPSGCWRDISSRTPQGVNRVQAETEITNIAEQRALEKAGFTREGVLRGATFRAGKWHDQVVYGVLRAEIELNADGEIPA